jgi:hypothetical protein
MCVKVVIIRSIDNASCSVGTVRAGRGPAYKGILRRGTGGGN